MMEISDHITCNRERKEGTAEKRESNTRSSTQKQSKDSKK